MNQRLAYLGSSIKKSLTQAGLACPSCGSASSSLVRRKYVVTALRRCGGCALLFRTPTTSSAENQEFYQEAYEQGFTTDCPSAADLSVYKANRFKGTARDYAKYVDVIRAAVGPGRLKLFEFGCSWGYGSWQLGQAGFEVEAFEISEPRARYAREKLDVVTHAALGGVASDFDVFFSSHVFEHVPSVRDALDFGLRVLRPGGLLVVITPNGSEDYRHAAPESWDKMWGLVHPNFLDAVFWRAQLQDLKFMLMSNPYDLDLVSQWRLSGSGVGSRSTPKVSGDELLVLARKR